LYNQDCTALAHWGAREDLFLLTAITVLDNEFMKNIFLFLQQAKLFMKQYSSTIGSKRKKITSKKATVPFLVGSIILQT
jgi:hypothetical protein